MLKNEVQRTKPSIWAICSGKGGTGKSFISSSLGVSLAKKGDKVLLLDADIGAANLHTFLGLEPSLPPLSNFFKAKVKDLDKLIVKTSIHGLDLISGANDSLDVADMNGNRLRRLQESIFDLGYGHIILDLGPGTSSSMVSFFLLAQHGLLIVTPEPTSIENTYRFIRRIFSKRLKEIITSNTNTELNKLIRKAIKEKGGSFKRLSEFFSCIEKMDFQLTENLKKEMGKTAIWILINQTKTDQERGLALDIQTSCSHYFGCSINSLGFLPYDERVGLSIKARKPFINLYPQSQISMKIDSIISTLKLEDFRKRCEQ